MKFLKKNKLIIIIVILCVGFFALISYTGKKDKSDVFSNGVGVILNPVQEVLYKVNSKIRETFNFVFNYGKVKEDNKALIEENNKLKTKLIEYEDLKSQNIRLKKMLDYKEDKDNYNYVGCDIVGRVGNSYLEGYTINKGTNNGIKKRMVAITSEGLVGQVTSVGTNWAIVQVLGNENISVAAFNQRSKENNGIVKGYKDSNNNVLARIEMSNLESDIKEGDNILTSGLGDIYPKGLTIGKIIKIEEDKGQFIKYGIIKPAVNMNKLEELFIVVSKETREINNKN
ncbi:rod shape-determining protein MreC [Hathewaya massiliensis]|uniref:rod shape-determining protein MreC n=1 Tax=Hathewaya massiliensis TaxID=1964382 RepID=UPI00115AF465|nr:rod shape-determining protein MreC [Hathewaya massiliensis]